MISIHLGDSEKRIQGSFRLLGCDLLKREMRNIRSIPGMFNRHGADIAVLVDIKLGVLVQIFGLCDFCHPKLNVQRVGVLKILDGHGCNLYQRKRYAAVRFRDVRLVHDVTLDRCSRRRPVANLCRTLAIRV